jgi:carbohydrate-binding DOMON domain-containing protein
LNVQFANDSAWEKVVIVSPQSSRRIKAELRKARSFKADVINPTSSVGSGNTITTIFPKSEISGSPENWRIQVLGQSNEGFPDGKDILTRHVNATGSEHRFGGGDDSKKCDPHVIDILGDHSQLNYDCATGKVATVSLLKTK